MIIVSLIGLKKCGKTTTAEALIREFKQRGLRVGGVKFMPHSSFTIDVKGKDTWRQKEAGADFVISLSKDELAYMEPWKKGSEGRDNVSGDGGEIDGDDGATMEDGGGARPSLADVLRLVPEDTDVLLCEGLTEDDPRILRVVLARSLDLLDETFEVRGIEKGEGSIERKGWSIEDSTKVVGDSAQVVAFSGIMANDVDVVPEFSGIPVFNCSLPGGARKLADLILIQGR